LSELSLFEQIEQINYIGAINVEHHVGFSTVMSEPL